MMEFVNGKIWKVIKAMFQTTNQTWFDSNHPLFIWHPAPVPGCSTELLLIRLLSSITQAMSRASGISVRFFWASPTYGNKQGS